MPYEVQIGSQILKRVVSHEGLKGCIDESLFVFSNRNGINEMEAHRLFHKTKELFDRIGIKFAFVFGSHLGAVREKCMIKGDDDLDICTADEEKLKNNLAFLRMNGLYVFNIYPGALYTFMINLSCYIDVYIYCASLEAGRLSFVEV